MMKINIDEGLEPSNETTVVVTPRKLPHTAAQRKH